MQDYTQGSPIYLQILQEIRHNIASGRWQPGMRIPPVRELSMELGVNPNTAQRSLAELEREGLVFAERTNGRFITGDTELIGRVRRQMATEHAALYHRQMQSLGYRREEMLDLLRQIENTEEGNP